MSEQVISLQPTPSAPPLVYEFNEQPPAYNPDVVLQQPPAYNPGVLLHNTETEIQNTAEITNPERTEEQARLREELREEARRKWQEEQCCCDPYTADDDVDCFLWFCQILCSPCRMFCKAVGDGTDSCCDGCGDCLQSCCESSPDSNGDGSGCCSDCCGDQDGCDCGDCDCGDCDCDCFGD